MIWRRGKSALESKAGIIDPVTHDAKIDDIFKMKTALEFDVAEYKFQPKISILELIFQNTKEAIGHIEFDLGKYTNKVSDSTVKTILDLKSDNYPGCQMYIYVHIQLLDPLPDQTQVMQLTKGLDAGPMARQSVMYPHGDSMVKKIQQAMNNSVTADVKKFDASKQERTLKEKELNEKLKELEDEKFKLEQENERLMFVKEMAEADQAQNFLDILQAKTTIMKNIKRKIDRFQTREQIIIKVL